MFCGQCGKKLVEGAKFCPECGAPVRVAAASSETPVPASPPAPVTVAAPAPPAAPAGAFQPAATAAPAAGAKNLEQALLLAPILLGAGAVLLLTAGDVISFLFGLAVAAAAYGLGYQKFKEGKLKEAKTGILVMGILVAIFAVISAGQGNGLLTVIDAGAAGSLLFAYSKI